MQVLLYLFLDLAIQLGITDHESTFAWFGALGAIFGIFPLIFGMSSGMVLGGAFVMDVWRGHLLIRNFTLRRQTTVVAEWLFFSFFLGLPLTVMGLAMISKASDWWIVTGLFWLFSIAFFFLAFVVNVIFYEMKACFEVMKNIYPDDDDSFWAIVKRVIELRQIATYSGEMHRSYLSRGSMEDAEHTDKKADNLIAETILEKKSFRGKINSVFVKWGWYEEYEEPKRFYSIDDARDVRPYVTSHTWSLEKYFCRPRNSRYIAIIQGAGAVTRAQMKSNVVCTILGSFLVFFLLLALFVWGGAGFPVTFFLMAIAVLLAIPNFKSSWRLYNVSKDIIFARTESKKQDDGPNTFTERDLAEYSFSERAQDSFVLKQSDSEGLYMVEESFRTSRPKTRTAWVLFCTEVALGFFWPTLSLFAVGNWPLALWYALIIGVSGLRYYVNAAVAMEEVGHLDLVDGKTEREIWQNQTRLNEIVGNITRGKSRRAWMIVISILAFMFLALFAGAVGTDVESSEIEDPTYTYVNAFEYKPLKNSLRYPTCYISSDLQESPLTSMADYIFLARVAYRGNVTQRELDHWFGENVAVNQEEFVEQYREENDVDSAVSFKLITYPTAAGRDFAYLAIRGTTNAFEALTDAQLWSGAILMQLIREMLPFGSIWIPIMPYLISTAAATESGSIDEISFYRDTTKFANDLQTSNDYAGVAVTGHSLGGGLSLITGAQAKIPAVALSGPNTVLTRRSLDPKVSRGDLDRYTFNIIPDRDVVPMIDIPAENYQNIRCNAGFTDVIGCHDTTRALCEAIFTCGSDGRPVPCECVTQFNYPEPEKIDPNSDISFAEACGIATSNTTSSTGDPSDGGNSTDTGDTGDLFN